MELVASLAVGCVDMYEAGHAGQVCTAHRHNIYDSRAKTNMWRIVDTAVIDWMEIESEKIQKIWD